MKSLVLARLSTLLLAIALPSFLPSLGQATLPGPTVAQAQTTRKLLKSGPFKAVEHPTRGSARIVEIGGKSFVELDGQFKTDAAPDLVVILHRSSAPALKLKAGDYLSLAPLRATTGSQRYAIPADVKLADYNAVAIWCRQFNATFGAATLSQN